MSMSRAKMVAGFLLAAGCLVSAAGVPCQAAERAGQKEAKGTQARNTPEPSVQRVLDTYRSLRPTAEELAIYRLDWVPTLKDAKERAAKEQRPILLIVVTSSYGNVYTGHG